VRFMPCVWSLAAVVGVAFGHARSQETMRLVNHPCPTPDGKQVVFGWNGDIWLAPTTGGSATVLTSHPAKDDQPSVSPDGRTVAFVSDREGSPQIFLMPLAGGATKQVTFHTGGYRLLGWTADGKKLLAQVIRDHDWTRNPDRMVLVDPNTRKRDELLFDAAGKDGSLSPDGNTVLFVREGTQWWRKGYYGSQAWQLWSYDRAKDSFTRLLQNPPLAQGRAVPHAGERGSQAPLWKPDGKGFYYVGGQSGSFNLWEHDLTTGNGRQLTHFTDDSVVQPRLSADGSTLVFRHLFDLHVLRPASGKPAEKINIVTSADRQREKLERRTLSSATAAAFTSDGLEIAFIAGGDVWVMDTELKEPKQVTRTPEEERSVVFSPDNNSLCFVSDAGGKTEIIKATRGDAGKFWWQNDTFNLQPITTDGNQKGSLQFSPDGSKLGLVLGRGDLAVIDADGKNGRVLSPGYSAPDFDWSPDGKWIAFSRQDSDFNSDIYILPLDGSRAAFNVSRHPDNEGEPVWSPDGKILAFTGRRSGEEVDIHYLYLNKADDERDSRDRALEKALEKNEIAQDGDTVPPLGRGLGGQARRRGDEARGGNHPRSQAHHPGGGDRFRPHERTVADHQDRRFSGIEPVLVSRRQKTGFQRHGERDAWHPLRGVPGQPHTQVAELRDRLEPALAEEQQRGVAGFGCAGEFHPLGQRGRATQPCRLGDVATGAGRAATGHRHRAPLNRRQFRHAVSVQRVAGGQPAGEARGSVRPVLADHAGQLVRRAPEQP